MSRAKLIALSLLAIFSASMLAASPAAAEAETRLYVEGTELTSPETFDAVVGPIQINAEVSGIKVLISCDANSLSGSLETEGKQTSNLTINDCSLYEVSKGKKVRSATCAVESQQRDEPIAEYYRPRFRSTFPFIEIEQQYEMREVFTNVPGKLCSIAGTYEMTGSSTGSISPEGSVEKTEHEISFLPTGSALEFNGEPASLTYTISRMKLRNNKSWRIG
jgi:hypothetical protein